MISSVYGRWPTIARSDVAAEAEQLVSWVRREAGGTSGATRYDTLLVARLSPAGALLDPGTGTNVASFSDSPSTSGSLIAGPALSAWVGDRYLLFWNLTADGLPTTSVASPICGATVAADGTVQPAFTFSSKARTFANAIASDGTEAVLVWTDASVAPAVVHSSHVDKNGAQLTDNSLVSVSGTDAKLAGSGFYLLTWSAGGQILGLRLGMTGAPLDTVPIVIGGGGAASSPVVAWSSPWFLVGWTDASKGADTDVYVARVGADGAVQDPMGIAVASSGIAERVEAISAAAGSGFLVTTRSSSATYGALTATRVDLSGSLLPSVEVRRNVLSDDKSSSSSVWNGLVHQVAYTSSDGGVLLARVADDGAVTPASFALGTRWNANIVGAVASNDTFLAGGWNTFGAQYAANHPGPWFGGAVTRIDPSLDDVDSHGARLLTAWPVSEGRMRTPLLSNGADVVAELKIRADADQTLADTGSTVNETRYDYPAASDGARILSFGCMPLCMNCSSCSAYGGQFLDASLTPISTQFSVGATRPSDVVWDGTQFILRQGATLTRLNAADGTSQGSVTLAVSGGGTFITNAAVVGGGSLDLVAVQSDTGVVSVELRDRALGAVVAPTVVASGAKLRGASWDGTRFILLWTDGAGALLATRISDTGDILDPSGFVVSPTSYADPYSLHPAAIASRNGTTAFVYSVTDPDGYVSARSRFLVSSPSLTDGGASDGSLSIDAGAGGLMTGGGSSSSGGGANGSGGTTGSLDAAGDVDSADVFGGPGGANGSSGGSASAGGFAQSGGMSSSQGGFGAGGALEAGTPEASASTGGAVGSSSGGANGSSGGSGNTGGLAQSGGVSSSPGGAFGAGGTLDAGGPDAQASSGAPATGGAGGAPASSGGASSGIGGWGSGGSSIAGSNSSGSGATRGPDVADAATGRANLGASGACSIGTLGSDRNWAGAGLSLLLMHASLRRARRSSRREREGRA